MVEIPVTKSPLDPLPILAALGVTDTTTIAPVVGGQDTMIWRVVHGGHVSALRVMRPEQTVASQREIAAMRAAVAGGVHVPRVEAETHWEGRPALLLEWLSGETLFAALHARPWRAEPLGRVFGRMQARIHALPAPDALRDQADGWITSAGPDERVLQARVRAALGPPRLLHLDYHPFNVLVARGGVTGVVDWTNAAAGDPRMDYAFTATILHIYRPFGTLPPRRARSAQRDLICGWQRGYRDVAGALDALSPFYAWAGAAILQDVLPRLGQPGSPFTPAAHARLLRWIARWKRQAGLS